MVNKSSFRAFQTDGLDVYKLKVAPPLNLGQLLLCTMVVCTYLYIPVIPNIPWSIMGTLVIISTITVTLLAIHLHFKKIIINWKEILIKTITKMSIIAENVFKSLFLHSVAAPKRISIGLLRGCRDTLGVYQNGYTECTNKSPRKHQQNVC